MKSNGMGYIWSKLGNDWPICVLRGFGVFSDLVFQTRTIFLK